jgi:hypothetical protein
MLVVMLFYKKSTTNFRVSAEVDGVLGVLLRTRSHNLTCPLGAGRMWRMGYLGYYFGQGRTI